MPAPPWHYIGDFLVLEYWADPAAVAAVLPPGVEPYADDPGRAAALFVDWQSRSEHGGELLDPARGQYHEFFIVVNAMLDGRQITTCPYIWVDRDFALVRGWVQGFPKKLGSVWMTRTFGLDSPPTRVCARARSSAARSQRTTAGSPRGASRSRASPSTGRRTTTRRSSTCATSRGSRPARTNDRPCTSWSRRAAATARSRRSGRARPSSSCLGAPNEEHDALRPVRMGRGFRFTFAYTVDDLGTARDLRLPEG